jgi:hypothetical protein
MVTLRGGITSTGRLTDVLGDDTTAQTSALLVELQADGLIQNADREGHPNPRTWALTRAGLDWLENGVVGDPIFPTVRARREVIELEVRKGKA